MDRRLISMRLFALTSLVAGMFAISHTCAATAPAPAAQDSCYKVAEVRAVAETFTIEGGSAHLADTYLTPLHYRGEHLALNYDRSQAMAFAPESWTSRLRAGINFDSTKNPSKSATMLNGSVDFSWAMIHRWTLPCGITLGLGPEVAIEAGVLYLERNGNNPASAKVSATIGVSGLAVYRTRLGRLPLTLLYRPSLPVTGAFFSPDYGELYYQIYMGQRSGLAHAAWWGNYFALENYIAADLWLGNTAIRVGYRNNILSTKVNDIVSRVTTHSLVLGVTTGFFSLSPRAKSAAIARIYQAY